MMVALIDSNKLRNKTIQELKEAIFLNKKELQKLSSQKVYLKKIKEERGVSNPIALIYNRIFKSESDPAESAQEQLDQCFWDEETVRENLEKLEKAIRMKELATINDWWLANEDSIKKMIPLSDLPKYKSAVFNELIKELEKDEAAFIQAADKILFNLSPVNF